MLVQRLQSMRLRALRRPSLDASDPFATNLSFTLAAELLTFAYTRNRPEADMPNSGDGSVGNSLKRSRARSTRGRVPLLMPELDPLALARKEALVPAL